LFKNAVIDIFKNKQKKRFSLCYNNCFDYENGRHWTSLYFDLQKNFLVIFDSSGNTPETMVKDIFQRKYLN
jgi:hypothetical protein